MKHRVIALLLILCGMRMPFTLAENSVIGEEAFAKALMETMQALDGAKTYRLAEIGTDIEITAEGGDVYVFNALNAYAEYLKAPEDGQGLIDYYGAAVLEIIGEENEGGLTAASLFVVLKPLAYVEELEAQQWHPVYDPWVEGLVALYVVDTPAAVRPIQAAELEGFEVLREAFLDTAMENILQSMIDFEVDFVENIGVLYADGMYESSFVLGDVEALFGHLVEGDLIVAVPERGSFYFVDGNDAEAVETLMGFAEAMYQGAAYPITDRLLRWTGDGFEWLE